MAVDGCEPGAGKGVEEVDAAVITPASCGEEGGLPGSEGEGFDGGVEGKDVVGVGGGNGEDGALAWGLGAEVGD